MFFVVVALGTTDLLFALDSIPAIYGLTQEPYLVFTANVFALMGLRQLYFLIGGLLQRLVYLSVGLSVILAFIGVKLVLHAMHEYHLDERLGFNGEIPIWLSLIVILGTLTITTVASLLKSRSDAASALGGPAAGRPRRTRRTRGERPLSHAQSRASLPLTASGSPPCAEFGDQRVRLRCAGPGRSASGKQVEHPAQQPGRRGRVDGVRAEPAVEVEVVDAHLVQPRQRQHARAATSVPRRSDLGGPVVDPFDGGVAGRRRWCRGRSAARGRCGRRRVPGRLSRSAAARRRRLGRPAARRPPQPSGGRRCGPGGWRRARASSPGSGLGSCQSASVMPMV